MLNLEKILRLHRDLNVNIEALDVVLNLLNKIDELQLEVNQLNNRLRLHESDD
ncbi:MAG: chaperone modulator CbpM [Bacteroidia bacterium]